MRRAKSQAEEHHQHDGRSAQLVCSEVTRVAREVGTEGKLGVQAEVKGVSGTWKDLTDNVNGLGFEPDGAVARRIKVATAIANGDLGQKIHVDVKGRNPPDQRRYQPDG
jgi:hypothetical protein